MRSKNKIICIIICIIAILSGGYVFAKSDVHIKKVSPVAFTDINSHWSRHFVDRLFTEGVVNGSDRLFRPDAYTTKAEAVTMLLKSDKMNVSGITSPYEDVSEDAWYSDAVSNAYQIGIVPDSFVTDNRFYPNEFITREEMAELTVNFMNYLGYIKEGENPILIMNEYGFYNDTANIERNLTRAEMSAVIVRMMDYQNRCSFYVDNENGNDEWAGTEKYPFKTAKRAMQAVREINSDMSSNIYVYFKAGYYYLDKPIDFSSADSGTNGYSVIYSSYGSGHCVLHGAKKIDGWKLYDADKNIYAAKVDAGTKSRQLYVNGIRAQRARSIGGLADVSIDTSGLSTSDTFIADFKRPQDLEFVFYGKWMQNRVKAEKITVAGNKANIILTSLWGYAQRIGNPTIVAPEYYENALELLDEGGEFYLDTLDNMLYYKPRTDEDITSAEVLIPVKESLVNICGKSDNNIKNISFTNISFAYTTWMAPDNLGGALFNQANIMQVGGSSESQFPPASVTVKQAEGITFEKCKFYGLGATGLKMPDGVDNSAIIGNEFYNIASTAICFGDILAQHQNPKGDEQWMLINNEISNNYIHDVAIDYQSGVGVQIGLPTNMIFKNNELFNLPYSGLHVCIGWKNLIDSHYEDSDYIDNYIHEIGVSKLYDGGGFYSLGGPANDELDPLLLRGNYFKNKYGVGGPMYFDEGSSNYLAEYNVIDQRDVKRVDQHYVGDTAYWIFVNESESGNIIAQNNYTTIDHGHVVMNTIMTNTTLCPDANWTPEALEIIEKSGISDEYKYLFPDSLQKYSVNYEETMYLKSGDVFKTIISDCVTRKDVLIDDSTLNFVYTSSNPQVASVDANGIIVAKQQGEAKITVSIVADGILREHSMLVYVDDTASDIKISKDFYNLSVGESGKLSATIYTAISKSKVELEEISFESLNPDVADITPDGTVTAQSTGSADIKITAKGDGNVITEIYKVIVEDELYGMSGMVNLSEKLTNKNNFKYTGMAQFKEDKDSLSIHTPSGSAYLTDKKYSNELITFNVAFDYPGNWPTISLRAQNSEYVIGNKNTSYLFVFKNDAIEVQRFTLGGRFVIYGDIGGFEPLGGSAIPNTFINSGEVCEMKVGAFNVEEGVRLVCFVDGVKVFDVVDNTSGAITEPGYFGVSEHDHFMTFTKGGNN